MRLKQEQVYNQQAYREILSNQEKIKQHGSPKHFSSKLDQADYITEKPNHLDSRGAASGGGNPSYNQDMGYYKPPNSYGQVVPSNPITNPISDPLYNPYIKREIENATRQKSTSLPYGSSPAFSNNIY